MPGSLVVINPHASRARDPRTLAALVERAEEVLQRRDGVRPRLIETASADAVRPAVEEALAEGVAAVVGVGGDGTMREIATVLAGTDVPLAVVPAGTANQVAAELGIPRSSIKALDALERSRPRTIDLGEATVTMANGEVLRSAFILGCGAGFDAELMATTSPRLKRYLGTAAYFVQGARLALRAGTTVCRLTVDEQVLEMPASIALIGNMGQLVPGHLGMRRPLDPADGLLELIAVDAGSLVRGVRGVVDQLRRTELSGDPTGGSIRLQGRRVAIEPARPMPLEIDGDYVGSGRLQAGVHAGAFEVLVPAI
jgi:diacylglycerol kinase family enzyme